ncbi:uncharacterized protein OCT59_017773 [Rhizophagus irregularis]|uniref:Uncharacterized protein n=2 Tax=Rhizophagus irregularis TaxID=588596 RepID=A0A015LU75_RHIIW|nr:hypothetical protein GLOIN_2v1804170 [Rhizophagus irregularis DAOM 181602=DAOM 197198]EXX76231.1 hypothetical protein RirG_035010 [Rhizophagus irregularis DAOM 197198w]POG65776.1 hypothetical protein GLOIN_2v1804170 [Rhizophagus irregularis DAOM 181602=DAOM 197198]UZO25508.1 hypothetical protein OCT59_017773 [Rhizophagus irregularis]GBC46727.1 hypothetical protein GLOIN_2v1804170 [Rhizophagus irregularis DAOM 181602=DAOM 197198]|eukprot:XP_025172642.1 hypothetical protein GLOIN_2v1804170 [Rhizophagus irregularis DAOM 181602=DAOM 197198]
MDSDIAEWLTKYSEIGSMRRELDDNLYIYLNFLNTILELKNMTLKFSHRKSEVMEDMQEIKLPALKKELIKCKDSIEEIVIKLDNMIVDEYCLRWNHTPIEGAYREWFKEINNNITKIDIILLDYVKDCFIETNGANILINWKETFKLINNEIIISKNTTNREDAGIRTWRIKNFLKILPTYETLWKRGVCGITNSKCPRCSIEDETWEHIWTCDSNNFMTEINIFNSSINQVLLDNQDMLDDDISRKEFIDTLLSIASSRSFIMTTEGIIREVTRGLINEKWLTVYKNHKERKLVLLILNEYLNEVHKKIWIERCNETIELEKQMGIFKDTKRKRNKSNDDGKILDFEKLEKTKNSKKIKKLVKIDLEEQTKNDVFRLGDHNRFKIASQVISNLVNT